MSKKLWHPTSGALVAGCLMATAAHAQIAPITPTTETTATAATSPATAQVGAPVPQRVAAPLPAPRVPTIELSFRDIAVKELLSLLGQQFNINLIVNADVDGVISSINLSNTTPDEALQNVARASGNLSVQKTEGGTYIVSKAQPGAPAQNLGNLLAPGFTQQPISPATGSSQRSIFDLNVPGDSSGIGSLFPGNQGLIGQGALPPIGSQQQMSPLLDQLPVLNPTNVGNGKIRQRAIKIKNVPSAFIAHQLDPANNPLPTQLQVSNNNRRNYGRQSNARNALGGSSTGVNSGFDAFSQNDFSTNQTNPYLQNAASSLIRPEIRANSQFGGNRGGGNRGGGNRGGGNRGGADAGGSFDLPAGIEQIVSVDPQNVLLIAYEDGNDEAVRQLQELIDVLDQPLRQVEIEAQFVELQSQDARTFGIDFSTSRGNFDIATNGLASDPVPGALTVGFVRNNFTARLNALIADNRAKVITAPRVTAINNLTASLFSTETRTLILTSVSQNIGGQQQQGQNLVFIDTQTGLTVTPTINGDDTITVLMQPTVSNQDGTSGLGTITQRDLETVANVRDGDTIALGGLKVVRNTRQNYKVPLLSDIPLIGGLFRSKTITENESELIIFLTARIIRRAGDDVVVPGT